MSTFLLFTPYKVWKISIYSVIYHPYQLKHEISRDLQGLHLKIVIPCLSPVSKIIHLQKLVDYLRVQVDNPLYKY